MDAESFKAALQRLLAASTLREIEEHSEPLADLRDAIDGGLTDGREVAQHSVLVVRATASPSDPGALSTRSRGRRRGRLSSLPLWPPPPHAAALSRLGQAIADVYVKLIKLRRAGGYDDNEQTTLCDSAHLLARLLGHKDLATKLVKDTRRVKELQRSGLDVLLSKEATLFHPDAGMMSANLLHHLVRVGAPLSDADAADFSSQIDRLLLRAGHYGPLPPRTPRDLRRSQRADQLRLAPLAELPTCPCPLRAAGLQCHLIHLLAALGAKYGAPRSVLTRLETRYAKLQEDVGWRAGAAEPEANEVKSPRKLLNAYNAHFGGKSAVLSLMPLAVVRHARRHARHRAPPRATARHRAPPRAAAAHHPQCAPAAHTRVHMLGRARRPYSAAARLLRARAVRLWQGHDD
jgi:hypothetical protein